MGEISGYFPRFLPPRIVIYPYEDVARRVWGKLWGKRRRVVSVFRLGWSLVWLEVLECVEGLRCGWSGVFPACLIEAEPA